MKRLLIICMLISVSAGSLYSQNKTIKGRVIDDNLETQAFVSIVINDTVKVGKTDINGFFQIEIPVSTKKLSFSTVGVELASIELANKCDEVEVVLILRCTCDFMTLKKVDKFRMKKFKKLPELHKEAFEKGLFKTDKACYTRKFIPQYKNRKE